MVPRRIEWLDRHVEKVIVKVKPNFETKVFYLFHASINMRLRRPLEKNDVRIDNVMPIPHVEWLYRDLRIQFAQFGQDAHRSIK